MNSRNTSGLPGQLQGRGPGLARGHAFETTLSGHQTKPEAIWTLFDREGALTGSLPANVTE